MTSGRYVRTRKTSRPIASSRSACQKAPRVAVPRPAHHVRVLVAQVLPLGDAERPHRPLQLAGPDLAQAAVVLGRVHLGDDDLAHLAAGAGHEHDAPARAHGEGHRAAGPDRLVVGVGVHRHQGEHVGGVGTGSGWGDVASLMPRSYAEAMTEPPTTPTTPAIAGARGRGRAVPRRPDRDRAQRRRSARRSRASSSGRCCARSSSGARPTTTCSCWSPAAGASTGRSCARTWAPTGLSLPDAEEAKVDHGLRARGDHAVRGAAAVAGDRGRLDRGA